jgi:hypothetical protein
VEYRDLVEAGRGFWKMGFGIGRTSLDLMKIGTDSYLNLYELYVRQFAPSEACESISKTINLYIESQAKVFENFKKLLDHIEKQQDEIFNRIVETSSRIAEKAEKKK